MADFFALIFKIAEELKIELKQTQAEQLKEYWDLLLAWNKNINLISPKGTTEEKIALHLGDSLMPLKFKVPGETLKAADFGSGGGLPAVPLKIMNPVWDYTLVEATAKKTIFLNEVGRRLSFANYRTLNTFLDGRENPDEPKPYDLITVRGLAETPVLLELGAHRLKPEGLFWLFKGPKWSKEAAAAQSELKKWNLTIKERWSAILPVINQERTILIIGRQK